MDTAHHVAHVQDLLVVVLDLDLDRALPRAHVPVAPVLVHLVVLAHPSEKRNSRAPVKTTPVAKIT